jgi:hypothetical protein
MIPPPSPPAPARLASVPASHLGEGSDGPIELVALEFVGLAPLLEASAAGDRVKACAAAGLRRDGEGWGRCEGEVTGDNNLVEHRCCATSDSWRGTRRA